MKIEAIIGYGIVLLLIAGIAWPISYFFQAPFLTVAGLCLGLFVVISLVLILVLRNKK